MDQKFLEVMKHEGPATIIALNAQPAGIVNTWMSYITIDQEDNQLYLPAAGMHSIEADFAEDNHVVITVGSKEVEGTAGPGAGFYIYGTGKFHAEGKYYDQLKAKFPWLRKILEVKIDRIEQKI
ncbi:pyridoxamine 5'-phosphate oxidase family protein [Lactobacillus sp. ESL0681]|uniref:pyridoxamine 5'-phosphate oxidase family protein n=1 Tax=Lactobacillus sp. ESL0681 TaxID=2983211 RepID=UPI0023F76AF4|nr:pyridoxamine 5'-phosphate oxidase family protein [Lactobacillus sp. ESL0681]WEV39889.1 pyridoxamine 5'-phosphate oxidase family protein [Lactobacillus sp. ESL0681]